MQKFDTYDVIADCNTDYKQEINHQCCCVVKYVYLHPQQFNIPAKETQHKSYDANRTAAVEEQVAATKLHLTCIDDIILILIKNQKLDLDNEKTCI